MCACMTFQRVEYRARSTNSSSSSLCCTRADIRLVLTTTSRCVVYACVYVCMHCHHQLYGVDTRVVSSRGQVAVAVLPFNDRETITEAGSLLEVLGAFEELIGAFWYTNGFGALPSDDDDIVSKKMVRRRDVTYYEYVLKPHTYISSACVGGQLYVLNASCSPRQWASAASSGETGAVEEALLAIQQSFHVPL